MGHENSTAEEKANSLFQVDRMFMKKILGRKSFVGQSMRTSQTESAVSVPFDWEMQPGTPKHPQSEIVAPIKPPPSVQSQALEKPSFVSTHTTMSCFWNKSRKKHRQGKKAKAKGRQGHVDGELASMGNAPESVEISVVNVESTSSSDHSRSSSLSSSSLSTSSSKSNCSSSSSSLRSFAKGLVKWSF
ncbi:hypothetical protein QQP08_026813 [Theobroma cacao]|uniref:Uncharacterized protein n=1 Tax=Theobroma cacao TaxID=3641 RepID=A0A061GPU6_THECC|nr:Uncharacterized protein TCM_039206 [Theobroma cacao]WRX34326.1 hypothetical protein QQP08_026813 [Theobroma cacao]